VVGLAAVVEVALAVLVRERRAVLAARVQGRAARKQQQQPQKLFLKIAD
jgi:hypothetical protein